MTTYLRISSAVLLTLITLPAYAGTNHDSYSNPAIDNARYDYAQVLNIRPVTEIVKIPEDQQVCRQVPVQRHAAMRNSAGPTIFGTILGGVIGSRFGGGHGKTAATIAGAAIGGTVANRAQNHHNPPGHYNSTQQQCYTETIWHDEKRVVAWDVDWRYKGETYQSRMNERPGDRIKVRVNVDPVYP